jgi:YHS domain-containing protein
MRKFAFPVFVTLILAVASVLVGQSHEPALGGYCPVAYKAMNKAVKGSAEFSSMHDGHTYLFVNAKAKSMFDGDAAGYTPIYDNYCATGVAKGMKIESDPTQFTVYEGKTYVFSSADAKMMFDNAKAKMVADATKNWPEVSKKPVTKM